MGASYSFGMDNSRLLKGFLRLRNGVIVFLLTTIIAMISGIMYTSNFVNDQSSIAFSLWIFEMINVVLIIIATIMIYSSITIISKNVNEKNVRLFDLTRALLLIFLILFSMSTALTLAWHILNSLAVFSFAKNMMAYMFLSVFLLAFSFSFKDLQKIGYGTRLLYIPLIFLTMPSVASLILGCVSVAEPYDYDMFNVYSSLVNIYMVLFLFLAFLELLFVLRRMTRLIDVQYVVKSDEVDTVMKKAVPAKK